MTKKKFNLKREIRLHMYADMHMYVCMQGLVQNFFEDDSNSRQAAGKKEFVSRKRVKKQKRYLLDTKKNLHKKFLKTSPCGISYPLFARLRPFWVVSHHCQTVKLVVAQPTKTWTFNLLL